MTTLIGIVIGLLFVVSVFMVGFSLGMRFGAREKSFEITRDIAFQQAMKAAFGHAVTGKCLRHAPAPMLWAPCTCNPRRVAPRQRRPRGG